MGSKNRCRVDLLEKILDVVGIGSSPPVLTFLSGFISHFASLHRLCISRLHIICEHSMLLCWTTFPQCPSSSSHFSLAYLRPLSSPYPASLTVSLHSSLLPLNLGELSVSHHMVFDHNCVFNEGGHLM